MPLALRLSPLYEPSAFCHKSYCFFFELPLVKTGHFYFGLTILFAPIDLSHLKLYNVLKLSDRMRGAIHAKKILSISSPVYSSCL